MGATLNACCAVYETAEEAHTTVTLNQLLCCDESVKVISLEKGEFGVSRDCMGGCGMAAPQERTRKSQDNLTEKLAALVGELFSLQDLNSDGVLDEQELVKLNEKIAMLHYGKDIDRNAVKEKYRSVFREHLDAEGRPVPMAVFSRYVQKVLHEVDPDPAAQELILEQFIAEAQSGREMFRCNSFFSVTDNQVEIKSPCKHRLAFNPEGEARAIYCQDGSEKVPSMPLQQGDKFFHWG